MKRWIISALATILILSGACFFSAFFDFNNSGPAQTNSPEKTSVTVVSKIRRKKKISQEKFVNKENLIDSPAAVQNEDFKEEEKAEEKLEEKMSEDNFDGLGGTDESNSPQEDFKGGENYENSAENLFSGDEDSEALKNYKNYALKKIASKKMYPLKARAKGQEGNVKLRVEIGADGTLISAEITQPCEYEELNNSALLAVRKSAPFKKIPAGSEKIVLNIAMEFDLR